MLIQEEERERNTSSRKGESEGKRMKRQRKKKQWSSLHFLRFSYYSLKGLSLTLAVCLCWSPLTRSSSDTRFIIHSGVTTRSTGAVGPSSSVFYSLYVACCHASSPLFSSTCHLWSWIREEIEVRVMKPICLLLLINAILCCVVLWLTSNAVRALLCCVDVDVVADVRCSASAVVFSSIFHLIT